MQIRVAVTGAKGRMGSTVVDAVTNADDMDVVARLDAGDAITAEILAGAQVAVDFSTPAVTETNVHALLDAGAHVVVGTTGWDDDAYARVRDHARETGLSVLIAPNFSMSAVLAMTFAQIAAPYFESAEVIEMHHPDKVDAPSGTAAATARRIARAREDAGLGPLPDATETDPAGTRGGRVDGIPVHAVRLRGLTASEEILLGNPGEQLVIRTDAFDRASFMPGVLLGIRRVADRPGLTIGLDRLLGL
ncbi:4-hydroxy-tetrahydrodipicolinate reductase [Actinomyces sp. B33]|uniref:4-hydroxy-tetrahydrodipicolinate reductase n=1 Tax=Actinomyces sp. B33 TaxID=2942131 RepID=UPI002341E88C|nr:4-hydroxy-tetrahydrodipicolinate reductase [Actinomyces sp. B33]MDC4233030.1 4-hydroxy-tetrahydrodipicolinate reductase [Actinomyces sp. B33]